MEGISMKRTMIDETIKGLRIFGHFDNCSDEEEFFVERHFLDYQLESDFAGAAISDRGIGNFNPGGTTYACATFTIYTYSHGTDSPSHRFVFSYFGGRGGYLGLEHGLAITDEEDNLLYWREPGEDEKTQWRINCMASDLTDADGNFVFDGDPCNI